MCSSDLDDAKTDNKLRLAFLSALEAAAGGELRLLFIADDGLATMLASLGIGQATRLVARPEAQAAKPTRPASLDAQPTPPTRGAPRATTPALQRPDAAPRAQSQPSAGLLHERAQRTLDLLSGRKG